ncbi:hypothetical protein [Peribacillus frigoritolerans]|uniref:hypothetical protein n=1 Tax=Peribacillus frigoritolerans TaxID=450367 RepID=UPI00227E41AC|nr:hypothetical protein [Peribacillus frigoritolerans]MCY9138065.1 hypothetical protein [Peribacillus frigoritolerans]
MRIRSHARVKLHVGSNSIDVSLSDEEKDELKYSVGKALVSTHLRTPNKQPRLKGISPRVKRQLKNQL